MPSYARCATRHGGAWDEEPSQVARHAGGGDADARRLQSGNRRNAVHRRPGPGRHHQLCQQRRAHHVGALGRQQADGRPAGRGLEQEEPQLQDQAHLHPAHRDGGQDRPGHRLRRGPRPDGHGPHLRPPVREGAAAGRPDRPDRHLAGAEDRQQGAHDGRHLREPALRCPAVRRRVGPLLQQGPLQEGRARPRQAADQPGRAACLRRQDHRPRGRHQGLLPAGQLRRVQHLHRRAADVGLGGQDRGGRPGRRAAGR